MECFVTEFLENHGMHPERADDHLAIFDASSRTSLPKLIDSFLLIRKCSQLMECSDRSGARGRAIDIYSPMIPAEHATSRLATARKVIPPLSTSRGGPSGQAYAGGSGNPQRLPATRGEQDNSLSKRRKSPLHIPLDNRPPKGQQEYGMTTAEEYRHIAEEFFRLRCSATSAGHARRAPAP